MAEVAADIIPDQNVEPEANPVWRYLSEEKIPEYSRLFSTDTDAAASYLSEVLSLPDYRFDARSAIRLDYASYALEFTREQSYGPMRTASLFNVAQAVLENCIAGGSFADCQGLLKAELLALVSPKPGVDSPKLSPEQVARAGQFFARTFFRHYRLYAYVFGTEQDLTEYSADLMVETAVVPPFDVAITEEEWVANNEARQAAHEAEMQAAAEAEAAAAKAAEEQREREEKEAAEAARQAELARKPATLDEAIEHLVAVRLEQEKAALAAEYAAKEQALMEQIDDLTARVPEQPPAGAKKK